MTALTSLRTAALPALAALDRAGAAAAKRVRHVCEILRNRREAAVLASVAYHIANRDDLMPRPHGIP